MNFRRIFDRDVDLRTSHLWIIALMVVIVGGFTVNCVIYPFSKLLVPVVPIDHSQLMISAALLAGIEATREFVLKKFKLDKIDVKINPTLEAENMLKEKIWLPAIGWIITFGCAINMWLHPFFPEHLYQVPWELVQICIAFFLTLSGTREYNLYASKAKAEAKAETGNDKVETA